MDIISNNSTPKASQGVIHHVIEGKAGRRLGVAASDPITQTYISPCSPETLYGTQSLQCLAEKCQKFGHEVLLLEIFGNPQRSLD